LPYGAEIRLLEQISAVLNHRLRKSGTKEIINKVCQIDSKQGFVGI
jgi:hypothetical protein